MLVLHFRVLHILGATLSGAPHFSATLSGAPHFSATLSGAPHFRCYTFGCYKF